MMRASFFLDVHSEDKNGNGLLLVTDPGIRKPSFDSQGKLKVDSVVLFPNYTFPAKVGQWEGCIRMNTTYPSRVDCIVIIHQDYFNQCDRIPKWEYVGKVGVDDGIVGIYNYDKVPYDPIGPWDKDGEDSFLDISDDALYGSESSDCSENSDCKDKNNINVVHGLDSEAVGIVCKSGFGDGMYRVYKYCHHDQVLGIFISFITDEEEFGWGRIIEKN